MSSAGVLAYLLSGLMPFGQTQAISLDGDLTEEIWTRRSRVWMLAASQNLNASAHFHLTYDDAFLYLGAEIADANLAGLHRARSGDLSRDDAVGFLLDFGDGTAGSRTPRTFSYLFSVAGGMDFSQGQGDGSAAAYPGLPTRGTQNSQVRYVVRLNTASTLGVPTDQDTGWRLEAVIPWEELGESPPFRPGRTIGVALVNYRAPAGEIAAPFIANGSDLTRDNLHTPRLWQRVALDWTGPLPVRGLLRRVGSFDPAEPLDRWAWERSLAAFVERGFNALLLEVPPAWLDTDNPSGFEDFTWLMAECADRDLGVYVKLPVALADNTLLPLSGRPEPDIDLAGTSAMLVFLWTAQPGLSGAVLDSGSHPLSSEDVATIRRSWLSAMPYTSRRGAEAADLIVPRLCPPANTGDAAQSSPGVRLLGVLDLGFPFTPQLDVASAFDRHAAAAAGAPARDHAPLAMIRTGARLDRVLWVDPLHIFDLARELRQYGHRGFFLEVDRTAEGELIEEFFGAASSNPVVLDDPSAWADAFDRRFGTGRASAELMETVRDASLVFPRLCSLIDGPAGCHMPQIGLPLSHYLHLPPRSMPPDCAETLLLSSPTWPWMMRVDRVAGIYADVHNQGPPGAVRPDQVAAELTAGAVRCRNALARFRDLRPPTGQQALALGRLLTELELNAALADHFALRITAARGFERFRTRRTNRRECLQALENAVKQWPDVAALGDHLFPPPFDYSRSIQVSAPPWDPFQLEGGCTPLAGGFADQLSWMRRELKILQDRMAKLGPDVQLPLWDELSAADEGRLVPDWITRCDFEADSPACRPQSSASVTSERAMLLAGTRSLLLDARELEPGAHSLLQVDLPAPPTGNTGLQIRFDYRVIASGPPARIPFSVAVISDGFNVAGPTAFAAPNRYRTVRVIETRPLDANPATVHVFVESGAALVVDNLEIRALGAAATESSPDTDSQPARFP